MGVLAMNNTDFQILFSALALYKTFMQDAATDPNENKSYCLDMVQRAGELQDAITRGNIYFD